MKKLVVLFLVISATISSAQDPVLLRLNYEKGASYSVSMNMSQEMGTMMSMGMSIDMGMKIIDAKGENYESEMKFTKISMDMLQGGNIISFDSSKSDDELDEAGKMMKTQMGPMLEAVVLTKGNNLGEITEAVVEPNVPGMEDIANQSSNVVYPKEAVKVGSTWTMSKDEKGMKMDFLYTVTSILKETILLDLSGDVSGMADGKITGNIKIDRTSGIPLETLMNMNLSVNGQELTSKVSVTTRKK
ncbi:MAG: DUF6263 family protein [Polaribacter sp.]|jgi:hypothetical protein|nr:DUF6263 family protein [Polaribacter sp.]MDG2151055.1 DUF6263 family protein [Polaribacter sp.]